MIRQFSNKKQDCNFELGQKLYLWNPNEIKFQTLNVELQNGAKAQNKYTIGLPFVYIELSLKLQWMIKIK